ncbi:MAG: amino acid adenylation domain-containing protein, partial [Candidatus Binatia bacterium]
MTGLSRPFSTLPPQQEAIRAKCFHPSGTFIGFTKEEVEQSISSRFERMVARHSERIAVKTRNCALTYDALNRAANRVSGAIASKYGAEERPIALLLGHDPTMIAGILGVFKTGKICVPLDPGFHEARIHSLLRDSQAGLVITDSQHHPLACRSALDPAQVINIDEIDPGSFSDDLALSIPPERPSYILYTSGSTGEPKGVVQSHRTLLHDVTAYTNSFHIAADDRLTLFASLSSGEGMKNALSGLLNGATVYPWDIKREGFASLAGWLIGEKITIWISTPAIFRSFIPTLSGEAKSTGLRIVRLGSATVRKKDVDLYKIHLPSECVLINWLSSTEVGNFARYFIDKKTEIDGDQVPAGYGASDKQVLLLDDNGRESGFNEIGEIAVKSRYLFPGYWRKDDLTRARFRADPNAGDLFTYLTGDLGRMLPDGCLYHLGRKDLQVKIRGYRIEIGEVESALESVEQVKEAVVLKREIAASGEEGLVAYIVPERKPPPSVASVRDALGEKLPSYMQPSRFVFLDALPLA